MLYVTLVDGSARIIKDLQRNAGGADMNVTGMMAAALAGAGVNLECRPVVSPVLGLGNGFDALGLGDGFDAL